MKNAGRAQAKEPKARISVMRDRHLVPLLAGTQERLQRDQPWTGILLEQHHVVRGEIPEHEHPDLCLHLQLTGHHDFEWWSEGRNRVEHTRTGSLIVIPPGTRDRLHWQGPSERLIVSVNADGLNDFALGLGGTSTPEFRGSWSMQDGALQHVLEEMGKEAQGGWPLGKLYADLLGMGLQRMLLSRYAVDPVQGAPFRGGLGQGRLRRALEYINANLGEDLSLDAMAAEVELSPSHFAHEFRNSTGQTPYQYLLDQRMARARTLLKGTKLPVQVIAAETGFSSPANFVRAFRQRLRVTPEAWRKGA